MVKLKIQNNMVQETVNKIRKELYRLNALYREGKPEVSDKSYDKLVELLRRLDPNDEFFKSGVVEQATERMEPLPLPMYSLEKVHSVKELRSWLKKMADKGCQNIIMTPKYDGISLLVDESSSKVWTRGDGKQGQRSDSHFAAMNHGRLGSEANFFTWGEAIVERAKFDPDRSGYKNARNMVAGIFNSPEGNLNSEIVNVSYIRYGTDDVELCSTKREQLEKLQETFGNTTPFESLLIKTLLKKEEDFYNELYERFGQRYKIDGVVFEVDELEVRDSVGRLPNMNPGYAVALKLPDWVPTYTTTVKNVEWGVGKDGDLCPVINFEPVEVDGATIERASGYNARYIADNGIGPKAIIEIVRSGDVIPKHVRTIVRSSETLIPQTCPCCGSTLEWDKTSTNLVCNNPRCEKKIVSQLVYFFRTMGCEEFEEPTIKRLIDAFGVERYPDVISLSLESLQSVLGEKKGRIVRDQIQKLGKKGVPMARFLTATNIFGGVIAEKTCQKILNNFPEDLLGDTEAFKTKISEIEGVGEVTAEAFTKGFCNLSNFDLTGVKITYFAEPKPEIPTDHEQLRVCMTGFRSAELEEALKRRGDLVLGGVTKECNLLVVADLNSTSSKVQKAIGRGVKIVDRKTFEDEIFLQK